MAINTVAQRQGEAASTLPREQVIECLADMGSCTDRFTELPEVLRVINQVIAIRGRMDCPDSIKKIMDEFQEFGLPPLLRFLMDGVQYQANNLINAEYRIHGALKITPEECRRSREQFEEGR